MLIFYLLGPLTILFTGKVQKNEIGLGPLSYAVLGCAGDASHG